MLVISHPGERLDGWTSHDLNPGAIIAAAPNIKPFTDLLKIVIQPLMTLARARAAQYLGSGQV